MAYEAENGEDVGFGHEVSVFLVARFP